MTVASQSSDSPTTRQSSSPVLEALGLSKSYGGVHAVREANLSLFPSAVHSLIGANGAGKSTLVSMLAGVISPDSGSVLLDGAAISLRNPRIALGEGVAVVPQTLELCPNLSVAENVLLPELRSGPFFYRAGGLQDAHGRMASVFGNDSVPSPNASLGGLSFADQQKVAIARATGPTTRVLILDEPTALLSRGEAEHLLESVVALAKARALAVLFVSHRLDEVLEVSNSITVMRNGEIVDTVDPSVTTATQLVGLMVGPGNSNLVVSPSEPAAQGTIALRASLRTPSGDAVEIELQEGEVVGILGVPGSRRRELIYSAIGASNWAKIEHLEVGGTALRGASPVEFRRRHVGVVPTDRTTEGLLSNLSARANAVIGLATVGPYLRRSQREVQTADHFLGRLGVVPAKFGMRASLFSGGNQQKIVLARALAAGSRIVVMDEPTVGVDVRARADLYREVVALAAEGMSFLVGSSDPDELAAISHRIFVIAAGRMVGIHTPPFDPEALLAAAVVQQPGA